VTGMCMPFLFVSVPSGRWRAFVEACIPCHRPQSYVPPLNLFSPMTAQTSALVASEYYMRNGFFPGWARPYEFASELLAGLGRPEEARDMARCDV
jgi:hypothetical protein